MPRRTTVLVNVLLVSFTGLSLATGATLHVDASATIPGDGSNSNPFRTIAAALALAGPGDTVLIRSGIYRERLRVPSGDDDRPLTLRAADGARVIVTPCQPITNWQPCEYGRYAATLDATPDRLYVDGRRQPIARLPREGWWRSDAVAETILNDPTNLKGLDVAETGGRAYVWLQRGNVFGTYNIAKLDTESGTLSLEPQARGRLSHGDKYWLENRVEFISAPGHWAAEPDSGKARLVFLPNHPSDLARVEAPEGTRSAISLRNVNNVRIEGLEIRGAPRDGIELTGASNVVIHRCVAYENQRSGISVRDGKNCTVSQCIAWRNDSGISVSYSNGVTVEQCDVGYNGVDGVLVTWKSRDVTVRSNYIHHHVLWGHPDNIQMYRDVADVVIRDNLLLAGGQSIMIEELERGTFEGNLIVGCAANMLIFGHQNAGKSLVRANTLAFSGYGCMSLTWQDYEVRENVFTTGHSGIAYDVRAIPGYVADRNLFFNSSRTDRFKIMATDAGWLADLNEVRQSTAQDAHSVYGDPKFKNAPVAVAVLDSSQLHQCTHDRWPIRGGTDLFRRGDTVEVNFDGQRRAIVDLDETTLTVHPPLSELPQKSWIVANWGSAAKIELDLRLQHDSPGAGLSELGHAVGATLDAAAYRRGDFDADGRRDLPELPPALRLP